MIDLLSLAPLDEDTILSSVRRTKHLVVVDEDTPRCSVARDIAAIVADLAHRLPRRADQDGHRPHTPGAVRGRARGGVRPQPAPVVAAALASVRD